MAGKSSSSKAALKEARELMTVGNFAAALKAAKRAANADPKSYLALVIVGKCHAETDRFAEAKQVKIMQYLLLINATNFVIVCF